MQQHEWIFKTLHWVKKARHKIHVTQNSIYKVHRRTKLIQGDKRSKKKKMVAWGEGGLAGKGHKGNFLGLWKCFLPWSGVLITHLHLTKLVNCTLKIYVFITLWKLYLNKGNAKINQKTLRSPSPLLCPQPSLGSSQGGDGRFISQLSAICSLSPACTQQQMHPSKSAVGETVGKRSGRSRLGAQRSQFQSQFHVLPAVSSSWATLLL